MADGVNEVLGQSGPKPTITHNGKTWEIAHPTQKAKAHLVAIVTESAKASVRELKPYSPPEEYAEMWNAVIDKITGRYYQTWHPGWMAAMGGQDGNAFLLLSLLRIAHPDATEDNARELLNECPEEVAAAFAEVMPGFFDLLERDFPPQVPKDQRAIHMAAIKSVFQSPQRSSV